MQHLDQTELAQRWRISERTLERWRLRGFGPRFLKLGGRCIYPVDEVSEFERAQLRPRREGEDANCSDGGKDDGGAA